MEQDKEMRTETEAMYAFLRERGVSTETMEKMKTEKIDHHSIMLMTDDQLSQFLNLGDRLAAVQFCKEFAKSDETNKRPVKRQPRQSVLEALRKKFRAKQNPNSDNDNKTRPPGNNAIRLSRNIEIGWIHMENGVYKQVRAKQGGGTRVLNVPKAAKKSEILKLAIGLFFPNKESNKGKQSDFVFDIMDFKQSMLDADISVGDLYSLTGVKIMRFYLATKPKISSESASSENDIELPVILSCSTSSEVESSLDKQGTTREEKPVQLDDLTSEFSLATTRSLSNADDHLVKETMTMDSPSRRSPVETASTSVSAATAASDVVLMEDDFLADLSDDPEIQFGRLETSGGSSLLAATLPLTEPLQHSTPSHDGFYSMIITRGEALQQLTKEFTKPELMDMDIEMRRKGTNGKLENSVGSGVFKDCLAEFWEDFYSRCTLGNEMKVPFIRHDISEDEWKAHGRILLYGWKHFRYLPIKLAPVVIEMALYDRTYSDLKDTFLKFVDPMEREILIAAIADFDSTDRDDLLEVLDNHDCRRQVTATNIETIIQEIAHKDLVQAPKYVIDCWRSVLGPMAHVQEDEIREMYDRCVPTNKRVLSLINLPVDGSVAEKEVGKYLLKYVRQLSERQLALFLRFTTGSDLITCSRIDVFFSAMTEYSRRPIGHTCGNMLELADSYENYPDLRAEFNKILESNVWVMDII